MHALTPAEKAKVDQLIRSSVQGQVRHRLRLHVDRPRHARVKVSTRAFAQAIQKIDLDERRLDGSDRHPHLKAVASQNAASMGSPPDMDAVYALLTLRDGDTSWSDSDDAEDRTAPLFAAVDSNHAGVLRLLLEHRAAPDGYQFRQWVRVPNSTSLTERTPLANALDPTCPSFHMADMLLRARADPEACGYKYDHRMHSVNDHEHDVERQTPLDKAVERACECDPVEFPVQHEVVRFLLRHGARPDSIGFMHYTLHSDGTCVHHEAGIPIIDNDYSNSSWAPYCTDVYYLLRSATQHAASTSSGLARDPDLRVL